MKFVATFDEAGAATGGYLAVDSAFPDAGPMLADMILDGIGAGEVKTRQMSEAEGCANETLYFYCGDGFYTFYELLPGAEQPFRADVPRIETE